MAALLGALCDLGYGVAFRTLDARYSGVPQRRRRVFILGVRMSDDDPDGHLAAQRAAEVLALTASECRHSAKGRQEGQGASPAPRTGLEIAGGLTRRYGKGVNTTLDDGALVVGEAVESGGDGAPDGAAGWLDGGPELVGTLREHVRPGSNTDHTVYSIVPEGGQGADLRASSKQHDRGVRVVTEPAIFVKSRRAQSEDDPESWVDGEVAPTVNTFDSGDARAVTLVAATLNSGGNDGGFRTEPGERLALGGVGGEDDLLPVGLDSHRYRACGNAVVVNVAEWLGKRIRLAAEGEI